MLLWKNVHPVRREVQSKSIPDGICRACLREFTTILDARVRLSKLGPKGHWVYLCTACQIIYGLGCDEDDYVVYQKFIGRWAEVPGLPKSTPQDVICAVKYYKAGAENQVNEALIVLIGEVAVQLSLMNEKLQKLIELQTPTKTYANVKEPMTITEIMEGSNDSEDNQDV